MHTTNQQHIVIAGSGNLAIATYKTLSKEWHSAIKNGKVRISIIADKTGFEHPGLLGEIMIGRLEKNAISCPLSSIVDKADIIYGSIASIDRKSHMLEVKLADGSMQSIYYNHLVLDTNGYNHSSAIELPEFVQQVSSYDDARILCHKLDKIVRKAAGARSMLVARNLLRFVLLIQNENDLALATYLHKYVTESCSRFYNLKNVKPEIYLVELDESRQLSKCSFAATHANKMFSHTGIRWIKEGILHRFAEDGVVLNNGCFVACSLIIHFSKPIPIVACSGNSNHEVINNFATDDFLRLHGESHIWAGYTDENSANNHHSFSSEGIHIARNIILAGECRFLQKYKPGKLGYRGLLFSNAAQVSVPGISIHSRLGWYFHIHLLLFKLPMATMSKNGLLNLISHFIWKKTKIESGLVHHASTAPIEIRVAS